MDKRKILDTFGCVPGDVSEDRLLDIAVDAYEAKKKFAARLQDENGRLREMLARANEMIRVRGIREQTLERQLVSIPGGETGRYEADPGDIYIPSHTS